MRYHWSVVVAFLFMIAAGVGEWLSVRYVHRLEEEDKRLAQRADEMVARANGAGVEGRKYQEIDHLALLIQDQIRWEPDSTRVIRSFDDVASTTGVKLLEARTLDTGRDSGLVAGGAYQRMRIEMRLLGTFWGLLQYVDAVERSAQPMVIESLTLTADRDKAGTGDLRMTVSALSPVPTAAGPGATTREAK